MSEHKILRNGGGYGMPVETSQIEALILRKTRRVIVTGEPGDGMTAARQFDAVAMCAGFKCSRDLLERLGQVERGRVIDIAVAVLEVVREQAGDHARHHTYFKDFPANVPDTEEFWVRCLREAVAVGARVEGGTAVMPGGREGFFLNLLSLPSYGRYQHSYEAMLAAHEELIPAVSDRVTVLHLGGRLESEAHALYLRLTGNAVPLSADDTAALRILAEWCIGMDQPADIPVRESRAVINAVRVKAGVPVLVTTVTDVLRLACELSGGDVSLQERTRFRSFRRPERLLLLQGLEAAVGGVRARLGDVPQYAEQWKRLGERIHPHEYGGFDDAQAVFAVARGEVTAPSFGAQVEACFGPDPDVARAVRLLRTQPGRLWRSADRLLRAAGGASPAVITDALAATAPDVAGRVLLSVHEHLHNRVEASAPARVFANRKGRALAVPDLRERLNGEAVAEVCAVIDAEIARRLRDTRIVADRAILGAALPLSGKPLPAGLGIFPRGSVTRVEGDLLRFFIHWQQKSRRTDYDLSALFLDERYGNPRHVSWTRLHGDSDGAVHSGDITDAPAPHGASEFIDIGLAKVPRGFIVPQVYIYSGEGFHEAEEAFFGFMTRDGQQKGQPFEARTVRMKSALYGQSRIAVPLVFMRGEDGNWYAKWLHLYLRGHGDARWGGPANQVEGGRVTASLLARSVVERVYLGVGYLLDRWEQKGCDVAFEPDTQSGPVTYIGLEQPEGLPEGSEVYTLDRLSDLIPV
jgi:hypothetical protein